MTLHDRISKSLCKATLQSIRARVTRPKFILLFLVLNLVLIDVTVSKKTKMRLHVVVYKTRDAGEELERFNPSHARVYTSTFEF